jgi:hypothetical protein
LEKKHLVGRQIAALQEARMLKKNGPFYF